MINYDKEKLQDYSCKISSVNSWSHGVFRRRKSATRGLYFGLKMISSPPLSENDIFPPLTTCFSSPFPPFQPLFFPILHSFYPFTSYFLFFLFFFSSYTFSTFLSSPFFIFPPSPNDNADKFFTWERGISLSRKKQ